MASVTMCSYSFALTRLSIALLILALAFITGYLLTSDSLALGYFMVIPVYVFMSAVLEDARLAKRSRLGVWVETLASTGAAAASGYAGYLLWISGH